MVAVINVEPNDIRSGFPEFQSEEKYTDEMLYGLITQAECYISTKNYGVLREGCRKLAIELMTAHLLALQDKINSGNTATGQITSSSIDSVSVSMTPPPNQTGFRYWLNLTPYGMRYLMLLLAHAPAGLYFGGSRQRVLR